MPGNKETVRIGTLLSLVGSAWSFIVAIGDQLGRCASRLGKLGMPRDGAIIFSDLIGKTEVLRVTCEKCGRDGRYIVARLIRQRGRDAKIIDWLAELTAECPKKIAHNMNDPCGAKCPQLPKVL